MPVQKKQVYLTVEQYLAQEESSSIRHEYIDGHVYAMTGVTRRHNVIALNISSSLRDHLRGSGCRAYMSDVKVKVEATNSIYYPDVMVSCDKRDDLSLFADKPALIVEVLSRSTRTTDRREKLYAYRQIASLKEYLIVFQNKQRVELHRKNENGNWDVYDYAHGDDLVLESMPNGELKISLTEIYEDVEFEQGSGLEVREESDDDWF